MPSTAPMIHSTNATRLYLLFALLGPFSNGTLFAQVPAHELHFVSREPDSYTREGKSSNWGWGEHICTDAYQVHMEQGHLGKSEPRMAIYVNDKLTGQEVGRTSFDPHWTEDVVVDKFVYLHGKLFLIHEKVDRKTGRVDVLAQEISLPEPGFAGDAKLIGTINFDPKGLYEGVKISTSLYSSANGAFTAFYFDGVRSKEDEQLVLIFMMDEALDPLWQQGYRIEFDSEKITTASVQVSDQGIVYALMRAGFKNKMVTSKSVNYGYQVFGMSEKGMVSQMVAAGANLTAVSCDMVLRNGTTPVLGGFQVETGGSTDVTHGYFVGEVDPGLEQPPTVRSSAFRSPVEERIDQLRMYPKSDGGAFLTGLSRKTGGTSMSESYLFAASFDRAGEEEWSTIVPRGLVASKSDEDYGYRSFCANDRLMLLVPDQEENLENYRTHQELKKVRKGPYIPLVIGFSGKGEPSYAKFGAPDSYDMWIHRLPANMSTKGATFAIPCSKKSGKKETYGVLFMDFL